MNDNSLGVAAVASLILSGIPFWLWKLYVIRGPVVRVLIGLFIILYGMALVFAWILGSRMILRSTETWTGRGVLFAVLLMIEAHAALMAALAMNFVGK